MRSVFVAAGLIITAFCFLTFSPLAFGQVGNGTITGTVTDPAGAVVAGATVEAKNAATGVVYRRLHQPGITRSRICR